MSEVTKNKTPIKKLMVIAGETSGDMRAAGVIHALKKINPSIECIGVGGPYMRQAGVETFEDITQLAVIGFVEVLKHLGRIKRVFNHILATIDRTQPDAVLLVDYPGFNLRLAKEIKKRHIPVIYYVSPQVWAWREKRVLKIKNVVDRMMVLFPFEPPVYQKYGMSVDYVGHPLVDEITIDTPALEVKEQLSIPEQAPLFGLMPGSRQHEITLHLPLMLESALLLKQQYPKAHFIIPQAPSIATESIKHFTQKYDLPVHLWNESPYDAINACDGLIVASGTATLEVALLRKPMVIIYRTSWISYFILRSLIKIPYIGLANIVAGKRIIEEYIQHQAHPTAIFQAFVRALNNKHLPQEYSRMRQQLSSGGANQRAAAIVAETLFGQTL